MTERSTQIKQVLDEVRSLGEKFNEFGDRLARIETKVEYQPQIDERRFITLEQSETTCKNNFDKKINEVDVRTNKRIDKHDDNNTWIMRAIILLVVSQVATIIFK